MTELLDIPVADLHAHPDNPRLRLRDDVVTQIAAEITRSGFGQEHALLVRPNADGYEILSGHHRHEAAARAGLDTVPCWVRDMDDDEAFMLLVLENSQGELDPLERGFHALMHSDRYRSGGVSGYAERVGMQQPQVSKLRAAAGVAREYASMHTLLGRSAHLYEVSKAPQDTWSALIDALVQHQWTVADTKRKVDEVKRFEVPDDHSGWLPLDRVIEAYLATGRPTSSAVERLVSTIDGVLDHIARDGTEMDAEVFESWLLTGVGGDTWDHRKISDYHANLITQWAERRDEIDDGRIEIHGCRAVDLIDYLEPASVDLMFTDPPYPVEFVDCWTELGQLATKALKPGGFLLAYTGQYTMLEAIDRLRDSGLTYFWCHAVQHDGAFFRMNATHVQCGWKPVLVFRNGPGEPPNWHKDIVTDGSREKESHGWQQAEAEAAYWISELSKPDDLVVDPFVGGGTTAVVCRDLGRRFVGCDIDEKAVQTARERLA